MRHSLVVDKYWMEIFYLDFQNIMVERGVPKILFIVINLITNVINSNKQQLFKINLSSPQETRKNIII